MRHEDVPDAIPFVRVPYGKSTRKKRTLYVPTRVVYFIRGDRRLKIGTSDRISERFDALQSASPSKLHLLGVIYGGENVESWCQYHCFEHRSHLEWFRWNRWTEGFVNWVLEHGRYAAELLCLYQAAEDRAFACPRHRMPPLPTVAHLRESDSVHNYRIKAQERAAPFGFCPCTVCKTRPWERWSATTKRGGQLDLL